MKAVPTYALLALVVVQLTCFLLYFPFSFNYSIDQIDQYYIILLGTSLFLLQAVIIHFSGMGGYFKTGLVYSICVFLLLVLLLSKNYGFTNQDFTVYVSIVITTLPLTLYPSKDLFALVWGAVTIGCVAELIWGLKQYILGEPIMGTLRNTGIYSCYLVVHIPLLYSFYASYIQTRISRPLRYGVVLSFFASFLLLICQNKSRSAIFAFLLVNLFYFRHTLFIPISSYLRSGKRARAIGILLGLIGLLLAVGFCDYLFQIKSASAQGRMLIWEVVLTHFRDYCRTGTGFGQAVLHYPVWQAQYFANNPVPPKAFFLSADDTFIFYNDVLQLFVEIGILPFVLLGICITLFFTTAARNDTLTGVLMGILVCSFTTYPLHVPYLIFICFFAFVSLSVKTSPDGNRGARIPFLGMFCVTLSVAVLVLYSVFPKARAVRALATGAPSGNDRLVNLRRQFPALNKDGKYLVQLGGALVDNNDLQEGIYYLREGGEKVVGYQSVFLLASACERSNKVDESISGYQFLSDYIPARFAPKYALLNLYLIKNDTPDALKMARVILDMPVKVASFSVDEIKSDVLMKYHAIKK